MNTKTLFSLTLVGLTLACSQPKNADEMIIGLNKGIRHDDFEYVVTDYKIQKKIGEGDQALAAKGNFYIVSFKTVNNARRVRHEWDNTVAYLVDESGLKYENDTTAQIKLEKFESFGWSARYVTDHQTTQSTRFVFDLPENIKKPFLMVRGSILMGDLLDGGKFEKTKVKLFE